MPDWAEPGIINQALLKLTLDNDKVLNRYFTHLFQFLSQQVMASRGSGMQNLAGVKELTKVKFPIPPLPEQKRIVSKIEELFSDLDAGVSALERARANIARAVAVLPITKPIQPRYIQTVLRTITTRNRLTRTAHEVARKTRNLEDVRAAVVPIAPVEEQVEIVQLVEAQCKSVVVSDDLIAKDSLRADSLRQSILKSAFTGELTECSTVTTRSGELIIS